MSFGQRLRTARLAAGFRQEDLAQAVGVSRPQIANLEADRGDPSVFTLVRLCQACEVNADMLLGLAPMPERVEREAALETKLQGLRCRLRLMAGELRALAEGAPASDHKERER